MPVFTQPSVSEAPSRRKGKRNYTTAVSKSCYKTKSYTISIQINMSCGNAKRIRVSMIFSVLTLKLTWLITALCTLFTRDTLLSR